MDPKSWLLVLLFILTALYLYLKRVYSFWSSRSVPGPRPVPVLGNIIELTRTVTHLTDLDHYRKYGPIYGLYEGMIPVLHVTEPEVIRDILVKDFSAFSNKQFYPGYFANPIMDNAMDVLHDANWKRVRSAATPAFSTAKLKRMFYQMDQCVTQMLSAINQKMDKTSQISEWDGKDLFGGLSMAVAARCGFGIELDTFSGEQHPFVANASKMVSLSLLQSIIYFLGPLAMNLTGISISDPKATQWFIEMSRHLIARRREEMESQKTKPANKSDVDFLQLMIEAQMKNANPANQDGEPEPVMSEMELVSQCSAFLFVGYETTAMVLMWLAYCLAMNPAEQDLLLQEIRTELSISDSDPEGKNLDLADVYESLPKLVRLQAAIDEVLRLHTPANRMVVRRANSRYEIASSSLKKSITIPKGTIVRIPLAPLHLNEKYFPDPLEFQPERFLPENASQIASFTYLPFGNGPRRCIGERFSVIQIKLTMIRLLLKYSFVTTASTPRQIEYLTGQDFLALPKSILYVGLKARN